MGTLKEFIEKHCITIEAQQVPENPMMPPDPRNKESVRWSKEAGHFFCTLRRNPTINYHPRDRSVLPSITTYFSMGSGHARRKYPKQRVDGPLHNPLVFPNPTVEQVLDCLASDASGYENAGNFDDWCSEYGYDADSRKAERTYNLIAEESKKLRQFLGNEAFQELINETERL